MLLTKKRARAGAPIICFDFSIIPRVLIPEDLDKQMKLGRQAKRGSLKSLLAGPFRDQRNRRERQELQEKSLAPRPAAKGKPADKQRRPAFGLEPVEPRLLMSADFLYNAVSDQTLTLTITGTSSAPFANLAIGPSGSGGLVGGAPQSLSSAPGAAIDITTAQAPLVSGAPSLSNGDTLNIDVSSLATLDSFVAANGGQLTIMFNGGDEDIKTDTVNLVGNSGSLPYGLTIDSSAAINDSASITAANLTLTSAQTAGDLLTTGLLANADTGINLTGASLTTTAGALTLNADSTLAVNTTGLGMTAAKGAIITSFSDAAIHIGGSSTLSATGGDVDITATVTGSLTATASAATATFIDVSGAADPSVLIDGGSHVASTNGAVDVQATSNVTIKATATPPATSTNSSVDAAIVNTDFGSSGALTVDGGAAISAHGDLTLAASSTLNSSTIADANVPKTAGGSVAVSTITGDTTAAVSDASLSGSAVDVTAGSTRTITVTADSSPGGSSGSDSSNPDSSGNTLANNDAATPSGSSITVAGAVTVSTDVGTTSATLGNAAMVNAGSGAVVVSAQSVDTVAVTAQGEFTQAGTNGVGVAVAIGVADRTDTTSITGSVDVTAGSLDVAVLAPSPSSFSVNATSGVGNSSKVGVAGSLGVNVALLQHEAYLDQNAVLTLNGDTNVTFESHSNVANSANALPAASNGTAGSLGIGASIAFNYAQDTNEAFINNGAGLTGADNLTLTAIGAHTMQTDAMGGGAGATAITPIISISVADDTNEADLGTGGLLAIGGALLVTSTLSNVVSTNAAGNTQSGKTGVGISIALNVVNDSSTATTGRSVTAGGTASFLSTTESGSAGSATASVTGAAQSGSSSSAGQSPDQQTSSAMSYANSESAAQAKTSTKGTGGASAPTASTSQGEVSVAGAVAVNLEFGQSEAYIGDGLAITAGGLLTVNSAANIDGSASASGAAVTNATVIAPSAVNTSQNTINLGSTSPFNTGDAVTYETLSGGAAIGGLTSGTTYYVRVASGGSINLYDTAAHANAGGTTGLEKLTSAGSSGQFLLAGAGSSTGTSVGAAVAVNYAQDTNLAYLGGSTFVAAGLNVQATTPNQTYAFNPATAVSTTANTINLGVTNLATGDGVTYETNGGAAIGGLTNGTEYFVNVQANGAVTLYDNYSDAVAGGSTGLITLTGAGSGAATMVNNSDDFNATAVSGAGGGNTGVAGSLAINIAITDTEADLGPSKDGTSSIGTPTIKVTGGGNVTLMAVTNADVTASATPANGGGNGTNLGVGISVAVDYAQTATLAEIASGVALSGAHNLTVDATSTQSMITTTQGGASGSTAITPVIAIDITDNDTEATLGTGAALSLTGSVSILASLTDQVEDMASGATQSMGTGVGITVVVTVVNDDSLATTGRSLATTGGGITLDATTLSSSQSNATASVAGGEQQSGSGQSVDNTTATQSGYGDKEVKSANSNAKGTQGSDGNNKANSSQGSISVAGAVAVNVEDGSAEAYIADGLSIAAVGALLVTTAAQVNGQAIASGAATTASGGTGVGIGVSVEVANETNEAYIGNGTTIKAGGLTVKAGMASRSIPVATTTVPVVDTTKNAIFLGLGTGLTSGNAVTYSDGGGTAIGGLTNGNTYYADSLGNGYFQFYDTAAHAAAGGATGLETLTSAGSGTQSFSTKLLGLLTTSTVTFNAGGSVTLLNLGAYSDLHTGDVVTYSGATQDGLTNGAQYYAIDLTNGEFQLASSLDNAEAGTAITLSSGTAFNSNDKLVDNTDNNRAVATSGASGGNIGVSVSLGVNVISNTTLASVGDTSTLAAPAVTITGSGNVVVSATSNESNVARALPSSGGAGGTKVGVGGSVGINVITDHTTAQIINGTNWGGTAGSVTIAANSVDTVITHGENGATAGKVAVGIGAAVVVVSDTTTAYLGTGSALAATGNVSITGSLTGTFETTTNANAAGSSVAVGASVSVSVISETLSVQAARSVSTSNGSLAVTATSTIVDVTDATASSSGESGSDLQASSGGKSGADQQAGNQLGNSDTSGASLPSNASASGNASSASSTSGSEGGSGSGGVGVAASVAVSVLTVNNSATVTSGADLTATGAVTVKAIAGISDTTQAIGTSLSTSSKTEIGAGVAVGVVNTTNEATVGAGSTITGDGITIEAMTPATDTFIVWGVAAAGGTGDASVAGSVAVNVINTDTNEAYAASGSDLKSTGGITVQSINNVNIQSLAASGAFSDGTSVGAGLVVAILNVTSDAHIAGNASATGAVTVTGNISLAPTALSVPKISGLLPATTSVAVAGAAGTGSAAVAATVIVDVFTLDADAYIGANSIVSAGSLSVTSQNTTKITTTAGALAATTGAAGIGISLDLEIIKKQTDAQIDNGAQVAIGGTGAATVQATSSETMLSAVVTAGIGDDVGFAGTASIAVITTDTEATLGQGVKLTADGAVTIDTSSSFYTTMIAGGVGAAGTAGIGAANTTLVYSATTVGAIGANDTVTAGGAGLSVGATESENLLTIAVGIGVGGTVGVAGSAAVNVLSETTTAAIGAGSKVTLSAGSLAVNASDMTSVISVAGDLAASGTVAAGVGVDVGVYTKTTSAEVGAGAVINVPGNVQVTAESGENLISVAAGVAAGEVAVGINAGVHVFTLTTQAYIDGDVLADGSVAVAANDAADINEIVGVLAAGEVGAAAGAGVNVFTKTTSAYIGAGASVTGLGQGSGLTVDTGQISATFGAASNTFMPSTSNSGSQGQGINASSTGTLDNAAAGNHAAFQSEGTVGTPNVSGMDLTGSGNSQSVDSMNQSLTGNRTTSVATQGGFKGVAVAATNQDEIRTFTVALGGGVVAVAISAGVDVVNAKTQAYIGANATVNTGSGAAGSGQTVLVGASDDFYHLSVGAGVAIGFVGVAPSVGVNIITDTTTAAIDGGATVKAANDIAVEATGSENIVMIGLGIAGGGVGIGGVVDVLDINNNTSATIGASTIAHAGGTVFVQATDTTSVFELSGALGAGALGGAGVSVGVMLITKTTDATIGDNANVEGLGNDSLGETALTGNIGDNSKTTAHGVIVQAESTESILHIVAAGGGGLYAGVAGAVGVSLINTTTDATIGLDAIINDFDPSAANADQSVYVNASDNFSLQAYIVGVAGGFVGVAGAVDVGTLTNNAAAVIQGGALVDAKDNVEVNAISEQSLTGYVISGDGGAAAIGAAVSVWSLGSPLQTTYSDTDANGNASSANAVMNQNTGPGGNNADSNAATQSQNSTQQVTGSGGLGGLTTSGVTNQNSSAYRVNSATGKAGGMVNSAAPTSGAILAMQNAPPAGTTGEIDDATVNAGANIGVTGRDSFTLTQVLGQVGVGVVAAGASVDIVTVAENVTAEAGGTLNAGGAITVNSNLQDRGTITALALGGGFVALGAAVVVVNDSSATQASLLDYTIVNSAASVSVTANASLDYTLTTGQGAIGGVTGGATFTELNITGNVSATIGAEAQIGEGTGSVGAVTVSATESVDATLDTGVFAIGVATADLAFAKITISSSVDAAIGVSTMIKSTGAVAVEATTPFITADAEVIGASVGAGMTLSGMLSEPTINGATQATIGSGGSITAAGLNVTANDEDTTATTTITTISAGTIAAAGVVAKAVINRNTNANVGTMTIVAPGKAVNINATSVNNSTSKTQGFSGGGVSVTFQLAEADVSGQTQASIGAGSSVTGALSVTANDTSTGTPTTKVLGIGAFTGAGAVASSTLNRTVEAFIGNKTGTTNNQSTFTLTGSANVNATSLETATVDSEGATIGLIALGIAVPTAAIEGVTRAYIGPDTTVNGSAANSGVTVTASDTSNATITAKGIGVSVAGGAVVSPSAMVSRNVQAFIDASGQVLAGSGAVALTASSNESSSASATGGGGGGFNVFAMIPTATISGATDAFVAAGGHVTAGSLNIESEGVNRTATATADVIAISIGNGAGVDAEANITGLTDAYIGANANIKVTGEVSVTSVSSSNPSSTASVGDGGAITIGVMTAEISVTSTTSAYVGNATILSAGSLNVEATDTSDASVTGSAAGGGIVHGSGAKTSASVSPTIDAYIGTGVQGVIATNVNVIATSVRAEGNASSDDSGGGGVEVGVGHAIVNVTPTISATIEARSTITAGGTVTVSALGQSTGSQALSPYITGVNTSKAGPSGDTITFDQHGLTTGDQVAYSPNGSASIQTGNGALQSMYTPAGTTTPILRPYNVIVVDANTIALGNQFDAGATNALDPFSTSSGVDSTRNMIRFAAPDNFLTGDSVVYYNDGNGGIGLTNGGTYFVRTIDAYTIELYTTLAGAEAAGVSAAPAAVSGNKINVANSFTAGEAVTYLAPAPVAFTPSDVNITVNSSTGVASAAPGANTIFVGNNSGFQAGDEVLYTAGSGASAISGLTSGHGLLRPRHRRYRTDTIGDFLRGQRDRDQRGQQRHGNLFAAASVDRRPDRRRNLLCHRPDREFVPVGRLPRRRGDRLDGADRSRRRLPVLPDRRRAQRVQRNAGTAYRPDLRWRTNKPAAHARWGFAADDPAAARKRTIIRLGHRRQRRRLRPPRAQRERHRELSGVGFYPGESGHRRRQRVDHRQFSTEHVVLCQ